MSLVLSSINSSIFEGSIIPKLLLASAILILIPYFLKLSHGKKNLNGVLYLK